MRFGLIFGLDPTRCLKARLVHDDVTLGSQEWNGECAAAPQTLTQIRALKTRLSGPRVPMVQSTYLRRGDDVTS